MAQPLPDDTLDQLFRKAHTYRRWLDRPVSDETLKAAYHLMKMAPTSGNCSPARIVFVRTPEAKERLKPCLDAYNVEQTMSAPVTAIVGYDLYFYEHLPRLYPFSDARSWFVGKEQLIRTTAFRNGSLQGGYLILAARAVGLDCGPMSGFDNDKVDAEFFPDGRIKSNFLLNLGYGAPKSNWVRAPRLAFYEACSIV